MFRASKVFSIIAVVVLLCTALYAEEEKLSGVVVGRTGEVLHISVPQPVSEGTVFTVKLLEKGESIAEARVLSCTKERPYIALAKVVSADMANPVPTGVHAYADVNAVSGSDTPKPIKHAEPVNGSRFSIQAGAFTPTSDSLRERAGDYWQAYRLNYSFLRMNKIEGLLSMEYMRGSGEFTSKGVKGTQSVEVIPVTVLGRLKPMRIGSSELFFGAGGGIYRVRSEKTLGGITTSTSEDKLGHEFTAGLESKHGWNLELRYRFIGETDIQGYSLAVGSRF